jgi:hypothetical protein
VRESSTDLAAQIDPPAGTLNIHLATVEHLVSEAIARLDRTEPLHNPLLWAARCSLDASVYLLRARLQLGKSAGQDKDLLLEAVAQSRAAVGAATFAAGR